ncbi:hypothetical protein SAMN04488020_105224 [Palleronia marisminoris]|uniref:DUF2062 domain-containing protein n=1 Tax=Palleronia marisminoris TaxID=315423 RepID=A0A1Y5SYQ0_9RHOB|nr:DUF2062 domain-containing protein [Palleronia marisminoris]SFG98597.1 hypothetical protein SAMN04488020_105224 [Palleronia marisminoris]SLN48133.1 hypothetical protein PAM7066_02168 [Palleronia marisminoris]
MFKRRTPRSTFAQIGRSLWPRGGWLRAVRYVVYRIRRLPDPAYKISRGIAAGVFASFTPLFGFHFFVAAGLAWIMGGNILAALLATFTGNPITFPIIAGVSVQLGSWILDRPEPMPLNEVFNAFSHVSVELWHNLHATFTSAPVIWSNMADFFAMVFLPYLVGGIFPGVVAGIVAYCVSRPVIAAYQRARITRLKARFEKRHDLRVPREKKI